MSLALIKMPGSVMQRGRLCGGSVSQEALQGSPAHTRSEAPTGPSSEPLGVGGAGLGDSHAAWPWTDGRRVQGPGPQAGAVAPEDVA